MSGDTNRNSQNPESVSADSETRQTPESTPSSSVREYLYLDQAKVQSYLSQIQGGLQLLAEQVERQFRKQTNSTPEFKEAVEASIHAELTGKVPYLLEGQISPDYNVKRERKAGNDLTEVGRSGQRSVITTVHHEALELVERSLGNKLVKLTGVIQFVDFDSLLETIKDFPDHVKNFNAVTGQKMVAPGNIKQLHYLLSKSSAGRILVLVLEDSGMTTTAYLERAKLTSSPQTIVDNYGVRFGKPFTILGVDSTLPTQKVDFSTNFQQAHATGPDMGRSLIDVIQKQEEMKQFWELRSQERHIYPLAMYREL